MAKPLRIRDILNYVLQENPITKEHLHSQNEIARTLGVSAVTVRRIERAVDDYIASGNNKENLYGKSDKDLEAMLFPPDETNQPEKKKKAELCDEDLNLILTFLEKDGEDLTSLFKKLRSTLNDNDYHCWYKDDELSRFTPDGQNFLRECNYITLYTQLRSYTKKMNYSDRLKFKPGDYLEIGVIPVSSSKRNITNPSDNNDNIPSVTDLGKFLFFLYLPFSRKTEMLEVDTSIPDFTNSMITFLILFFNSTKGLPMRVIGEARIEKLFNGADFRLLKDFFSFCNLTYSTDKSHSVFKEREKELIAKVIRSLNAKTDKTLPKKHQDRIDKVCWEQNKEVAVSVPFKDETLHLSRKQYPAKHYVHEMGVSRLQRNNHIKFAKHWYSSKYNYKEPEVALEFTEGEINLITKVTVGEEEKVLSRHTFVSEGENNRGSYSTNEEDLAPNDEIASTYKLWTENNIIKMIAEKYVYVVENNSIPYEEDPVLNVAQNYINSRIFKQQSYNLLNSICKLNINPKRINEVRDEFQKVLSNAPKNNAQYYSWGGAVFNLYKNLSENYQLPKQENYKKPHKHQ